MFLVAAILINDVRSEKTYRISQSGRLCPENDTYDRLSTFLKYFENSPFTLI